MNLISLFLVSVLTENVVLTKFLGICPFLGSSKKGKTALGMGIAVITVVTLSSLITYLLYHYVLVPSNTTYLRTVLFILVIASFVQMLELLIQKYSPSLYKSLGIYLPLITTNCAVLGITLLNIDSEYNLLETLVYSFGSSLGFCLVIYVFSSLRERLEETNVPKFMKGYPISFVTAFIMALVFGRYVGK